MGTVELSFASNGLDCLRAVIKSLEFGVWKGHFFLSPHEPAHPEGGVLEGPADAKGAYFRLAYREAKRADGVQSCFIGGLYSKTAKLKLELRLNGRCCKPLPEGGYPWEPPKRKRRRN